MTTPLSRTGSDRCPTVTDLHEAADGPLVRIRVPGGKLSHQQLTGLAQLSLKLGDGNLDLTSRANVQLRGLTTNTATALSGALRDLGLFPSQSHERARGIMASPLGSEMLDVMVQSLDRAICAAPELGALSGRFLFVLDDGSLSSPVGDCDLGAIIGPLWDSAQLVVDGRLVTTSVDVETVIRHLILLAQSFVSARGGDSRIWRVRDLAGRGHDIAGGLEFAGSAPMTSTRIVPGPVGDGRMVVVAPLGRLNRVQLKALAAATGPAGSIRIAAFGRIVVPVEDSAPLQSAGLIVSPVDPRADVSACAGLGCARAITDVRSMAKPSDTGAPIHYSACERECGKPHDAVGVIA